MILSVSRRTDIPQYYSDWFFNRMKEGFLYVKNPMNSHQVSRIELSPDLVDLVVFWTKNPEPMMKRIDELGEIPYSVHHAASIRPLYQFHLSRELPETRLSAIMKSPCVVNFYLLSTE